MQMGIPHTPKQWFTLFFFLLPTELFSSNEARFFRYSSRNINSELHKEFNMSFVNELFVCQFCFGKKTAGLFRKRRKLHYGARCYQSFNSLEASRPSGYLSQVFGPVASWWRPVTLHVDSFNSEKQPLHL